MAATDMSVIHIDSSAPTTRKPSSTRSVRVPTTRSTCSTIRVPRPDRENPVESSSTPMKKVISTLPKPARTTAA